MRCLQLVVAKLQQVALQSGELSSASCGYLDN